MTTQSSFRFLAAIMVAFSLFFVTACGSVEEDTPTPTADTGYELGPDASPDATGTDTAPEVPEDEFTYSELCSECESRGLECPEPDQLLNYRPKAAIDTAATALCVPPSPPSPCDGYEWIEEVEWQCDHIRTFLTLTEEVEGACHAAFEDGSNLPFREEGDNLILYDYFDTSLIWTCTPQ